MIRSAVIFAMVLSAGRASAGGPPDPVNHTCPSFIYLVGTVDHGARPDPFGLGVVKLRDIANDPIVGARVKFDFTAACDISLCGALMNGVMVECVGNTVEGISNAQGDLEFIVMGAGNQPGTPAPGGLDRPGGGLGSVKILLNDTLICSATAVCLDQNGANGPGFSGVSGSDLGWLASLVGRFALGGPYRGRGDLFSNGVLAGNDIAVLATHLGRLGLVGGDGCRSQYCIPPACP